MVCFLKKIKTSYCFGGVFFALFASAIFALFLNYEGYCFSKGKIMTDWEKITMVVDELIVGKNQMLVNLGQGDHEWIDTVVAYQSSRDFFSKNPVSSRSEKSSNCCDVFFNRMGHESIHSEETPSLMDRLLGTYNGEVRLTFSVQYSDDMGLEKSVPQSWNVRVTNCGIYKR